MLVDDEDVSKQGKNFPFQKLRQTIWDIVFGGVLYK